MAKQFQFREGAREQLMEGIDLMAKTVGITLGPNGRNVVLDKEFGPPQVCSDGVTIAKEIELEEPFSQASRGKGSVIVFDSRVYHEITPVIKGVRYSLVKWYHGDEPLK